MCTLAVTKASTVPLPQKSRRDLASCMHPNLERMHRSCTNFHVARRRTMSHDVARCRAVSHGVARCRTVSLVHTA